MPLFSRRDGDLMKDVSLVRGIMPYIMPTRTEAFILYEQIIDLSRALPFIEEYNRKNKLGRGERLTLFHIIFAAVERALVARPGLNRFVAGGKLYQRRGTFISFTVKKEMKDDSPMQTVKLEASADEPLEETIKRMRRSASESRTNNKRPIDKELKLFLRLPSFVLRQVVRLAKGLDNWNLFPYAMIRDDPMYATFFFANLGSVGIDRVFHHLYEYGNVGLFCAIGEVCKMVVPGPDDKPIVRPSVRLRYTFDERINDGHYCAETLAIARGFMENPALLKSSRAARPLVAEEDEVRPSERQPAAPSPA